MSTHGHFGCPECGCREFVVSKNYTEYGSCNVLCSFNDQSSNASPDFDDDEYMDHDSCETSYEDYGEEMVCNNCDHTFTDPAWYEESAEEQSAREAADDAKRIERAKLIEEKRQENEKRAPYTAIVSKLEWADDIHIDEMAHAMVIRADVSHYIGHDESRREERVTLECSSCGDDFEHLDERVYQMYFAAPHMPSGREKWLDKRNLPVMLSACLCKACQNINVIQRPATAA